MMHTHDRFGLQESACRQGRERPEGNDVTPTIWPPAPNQADTGFHLNTNPIWLFLLREVGVNWIKLIPELANSPLF